MTGQSQARSSEDVITSIDRLGGDIAQRQNVDNSWELFARLPGVVLTDFNQGAMSGRFSIRGFNAEAEISAVKLLLDGLPSNENGGRMDFIDLVSPLDIASIELVRGTSDARWGLHSIAGNANINTRTGGTYLDAKAMAGSFGMIDGQVSAGLERGDLSQKYSAAYRQMGGYRDHSDLSRYNLTGKWTYDLGGARVGAIARYSYAEGEEAGFLTEADLSVDRRQSYETSSTDGSSRKLWQVGLTLDAHLTSDLALSAKAYGNSIWDERIVRFSEAVAQQRRLADEKQWGFVTGLNWEANDWIVAEVGGDVQWQDNKNMRWTTDRRVLGRQTRSQDFGLTVGGAYALAILTPTPWLTVTPAWRLDWVGGDYTDRLTGGTYRINDYGTISQPKISVAIEPVDGVTAYANWGRTFQIGYGAATYVVPPRVRDVAPSRNDGWEAGLKFTQGRWLTARAALWKQVATGELRARINDPAGEFDNLGGTRRHGLDLQVNLRPVRGLSAWASWSRQFAKIATPDPARPDLAGNWIDHVPENVFTAGVEWSPVEQPWRLSLRGNGQSSYELTTDNNRGRYGDYLQVTAEAGWKLTPTLEASVQVRNLLNDRYAYVWYDGRQSLHATADPRTVAAALRVTL